MTSEKALLSTPTRRRFGAGTGYLLLVAMGWAVLFSGLAGCQSKVTRPTVMTSPYPAEKLWAVAPFRNESGTSLVDSFAMADRLTQQLQQIEGITVLPVNRVLAAMAANEMAEVNTAADAQRLMLTLQADGLLVGTVTAWDPYEPPKIGSQVQLYAKRHGAAAGTAEIGRSLTYAATDVTLPGAVRYDQPVATAGGYFDAANGDVEYRLRSYAHGRSPKDSPSGWRRYLLNMDLYSEFVSHELTRRLFTAEWQRLTGGRQIEAVTHRP